MERNVVRIQDGWDGWVDEYEEEDEETLVGSPCIMLGTSFSLDGPGLWGVIVTSSCLLVKT